MKKLILFIYIILNLNFLYAENLELKLNEDVKIEEIQNQIKNLENKMDNIVK